VQVGCLYGSENQLFSKLEKNKKKQILSDLFSTARCKKKAAPNWRQLFL
jgi:hypothetical protein